MQAAAPKLAQGAGVAGLVTDRVGTVYRITTYNFRRFLGVLADPPELSDLPPSAPRAPGSYALATYQSA